MAPSDQMTMPGTHPDTQGDQHRLFERISRERFDALALWGMPQQMILATGTPLASTANEALTASERKITLPGVGSRRRIWTPPL